MAKLEDVLARCLDRLEQGDSVEDCLARYPEIREVLSPLLWAAQTARQVPDVKPSPSFRQGARARLLDKINARTSAEEEDEKTKQGGLLSGLKARLSIPIMVRGLAAPALAAITVLVLLGVMGIGVVHASSDSLPGDPLYGVKLAGERVQLALRTDHMAAARLHLRFAEERLQETTRLTELGRGDDVALAMDRYVGALDAASDILHSQRAAGRDVTALAENVRVQAAEHQAVLRQIQRSVGEENEPAVGRALAASRAAVSRASEPPKEVPQASPTSRQPTATATVTPTETGSPTATVLPSETPEPTERGKPTQASGQPDQIHTPQPPGRTRTPQPPGQTKTPQPPGQTHTPEPPGQTRTPAPPGRTHTPEPPGQTRTPQPPGQTHTPERPGQTRTPEPPGQTHTPEPPGQTRTPEPPGQTHTPEPPGQTRTPGPP